MAINIYSPKYSFVQYRTNWEDKESFDEKAVEGNDLDFSLPCRAEPFVGASESLYTEMQHQFVLETTTISEANYLMTVSPAAFQLFVVPTTGRLTPPPITPLEDLIEGYIFRTHFYFPWMSRYRISPTKVLVYVYYFPHIERPGTADVWANHSGECFQLVILIKLNPIGPFEIGYLSAISNQFHFVKDLSYTTLIKYKGEQDEAGFNYCPDTDITNSVRIPIYLKAPQYPEEISLYRNSSGRIITNKEIVTKQYEVESEYMPEWAHDCLRAALAHDYFYVVGKKYVGNGKKSGAYNIDWEDHDYPSAKTKFKFDTVPVLIKNNNCSECTPFYWFITIESPIGGSGVPGGSSFIDLTALTDTEETEFTYGFEIIAAEGVIASASIVINQQDGTAKLEYTIAQNAQPAVDLPVFAVFASNENVTSNIAIINLTIQQL